MTGSAWLVVYDCGCTDTAAVKDRLTRHCPGHNRPAIYVKHGWPKADWRSQVIRVDGQPIKLGHECDRQPCP